MLSERCLAFRVSRVLKVLSLTPYLPRSLAIVSVATLIGYTSFFLLVAVLPLYFANELGFSPSQIGTVIGFTYLVNFLAYVTVGSAADRGHAARCIIWSAVGVAFAAPLFALFRDVWLLALTALWQGLTMSAFVVATTAFAGNVADDDRLGAQMAIFAIFRNVASAAAPTLGVIIFKVAGMQVLLLCSVLAGVAAALLGAMVRRGGDAPSAPPKPLREWLTGSLPLFLPALTVIAMGVSYGVTLAFMPGLLATHGVGNPGLFYTAQVGAQLALRSTAGGLSDRYGRSLVAGTGLVLMGISVLHLPFISTDIGVLIAGVVFGVGWATFGPVVLAWLFDRSTADRRGLASAVYFTAQDIGRALGSIGLGYTAAELDSITPFVIAGLVAAATGLGLLGLSISSLFTEEEGEHHAD
jgi:MFS family permease